MRELTLEEVQKISLEIFTKFDEICREHNLKYFMMYGTLLGAVRHKGFIPWDDASMFGCLEKITINCVKCLKNK